MLGFSLVMEAEMIRALRARNGWTQDELAVRLGTDPVTVSRWERGVSRPRPSAQIRLSELKSGLPSDIRSLVRLVGASQVRKVLRRSILLAHRLPFQGFAADPARRLREVERAQREQVELKASTRLKL